MHAMISESKADQGRAAVSSAAGAALVPAGVAARTVWIISGIVALVGMGRDLAVYFLAGNGHLLSRLSLDAELSIPAWYSSALLLGAGLLLGLIAAAAYRQHDVDWRRWALLALIFVVMSLDETVGLRDPLNGPLAEFEGVGGAFHFGWVGVALPVLAALGLYMLPFLRRMPIATRTPVIVAGLLYVGGALGMEMVGGAVIEAQGEGLSYTLCVILEEFLEIAGATLFLVTLLRHLRPAGVRIEFSPHPTAKRSHAE